MKIIINGKEISIAKPILLKEYIDTLGLGKRRVVVILNEQIEKKNPILKEGDKIEIISFVGGGSDIK